MRVHATRFNAPNGKKDKNGRTFAEDWERKGHGEWCHGRVTFVYKKKSRQPQKYRILYDEGTVMESQEEHMEAAGEGDSDAEEDTTEDLEYTQAEIEDQEDGPPDNEEEGEDGDPASVDLDETDDESEDDETVTVGGVVYPVRTKRKR